MSVLGIILLYVALGYGVYAIIQGVCGVKSNRDAQIAQSRQATMISVLGVFGAAMVLLWAFISNNFSFAYVMRNSQRSLPLIHKISAFWAGQAGSLLLWLFILSIMAAIIHWNKNYRDHALDAKLVTVANVVRVLFIVLLLFVTSPFEMAEVVPHDGQGLNPMLQSLGMVVHPPILFLGYSGFLIPCAFVIVDLLGRKRAAGWLKRSRPWVLFSWAMLTAGIVTGGQWAYTELGWGGYWAWDPVENASLFPWLTSTALVHSLLLPKNKRHTKWWSFSLIMLTFLLVIFGTFLTRSGVLDSVHAFSNGALGYIFLGVLVAFTVLALYLGITRRKLLKDEESAGELSGPQWLSKWTGIQVANVVFLIILAGVFLGTMFPLISRSLMGRQVVLDESFFNQISIPLFLVVISIMGTAPLFNWQKTSPSILLRRIWLPGLVAIGIAVYTYSISSHFLGSLSFAIGAFGLVAHLQDLVRQFSQRKLGAYLAHTGIILMLVGITGSSIFVEDVFQTINPGETITIGDYALEYSGLNVRFGVDHHTVGTSLQIFRDGQYVGDIASDKTFYGSQDQPSTDVGIFSTLKEDLYLNLAGWQSQTAQLHIQRFGLVSWIWIGSFILYLGVLVIAVPVKRLFAHKQQVGRLRDV